MVVDTSALLAFFDSNEPQHEAVSAALQAADEPFIVSPYVIAELDYLVLSRHGVAAQREVLGELTGGAWELAHMDRERLQTVMLVVEQYSDVPEGAADASNMVLAQAYGTRTIATLDRRHFTILRFSDGSAPHLLP